MLISQEESFQRPVLVTELWSLHRFSADDSSSDVSSVWMYPASVLMSNFSSWMRLR